MLGSRGCPHGGLLYPRPHMTGLVPSRPCLLPWPGISAPPVPLRCQYSSCLAERCQGAVPVRPPVPPLEPAGEGLLWHPLRGPRQAEGERLCGVTEAPCRARRGMAAVWCCIVCSVWRWAALCSSCPHCVPTLVCAVPLRCSHRQGWAQDCPYTGFWFQQCPIGVPGGRHLLQSCSNPFLSRFSIGWSSRSRL